MALAVASGISACISNDLPYPWVQPVPDVIDVQPTDAEGHELLSAPVSIDSAGRTVTIYLTEYADIQAVRINSWQLSEGSECLTPGIFDKPLDLSSPVDVILGMYDREFTWTITAEQTIERYFTIASQIGAAEIDPEARTVRALVPEQQSLASVAVHSLKLAGPLASYSPNIAGEHVDFTSPVKIDVTEFGRTTEWTVTVEQTDVSVAIDRVDAWSCVAWVYASAETGKSNRFEYRLATDEVWTPVPDGWVTAEGGSFKACLRHLMPETQYVVRALSDDENSAEVEFTTEGTRQLPNSDFTDWWLNNKVWNPWVKDGESFWDTGNRGAATLGQSNSLPVEDALSATGYQGAMLQTRFIGVSILGKLAAGNLFAGSYVRTDGTNGILSFGREFNLRPTRLHVRMKYTTAPITDASKTNPDFTSMIGQPDTCIVWCALTDGETPVEIRTKPTDRKLFDRTASDVIAYGEFTSGESIEDYIDVVFDLEYVATDRIPRFLLVTASASKYGDYFTGGRGATLYIDSYELIYDY